MAKDNRDRDKHQQHGQRPAPPSPIDLPPEADEAPELPDVPEADEAPASIDVPEAPSVTEGAPLEQTLDSEPTHVWIYNADDCVRNLAYRAKQFGTGSPAVQNRIGPRSDMIPVVFTPGLNLKLISDLKHCGFTDFEKLGDVSGGMLFPIMAPTYLSKHEVARYLERTVSKFALERWLDDERREDVREKIAARLELLNKRK